MPLWLSFTLGMSVMGTEIVSAWCDGSTLSVVIVDKEREVFKRLMMSGGELSLCLDLSTEKYYPVLSGKIFGVMSEAWDIGGSIVKDNLSQSSFRSWSGTTDDYFGHVYKDLYHGGTVDNVRKLFEHLVEVFDLDNLSRFIPGWDLLGS